MIWDRRRAGKNTGLRLVKRVEHRKVPFNLLQNFNQDLKKMFLWLIDEIKKGLKNKCEFLTECEIQVRTAIIDPKRGSRK